ncbi:PQQ-like beta-propeller repeat protein [Acidobacteria bacterium AH-259-G07]|nr:PQQ-like beta-propeller repeat protein [Acidobacteria bacterium AH-259-G07]
MRFRLFFALLIALVLTGAAVGAMAAPDWPQWRGPDRTGVSQEKGLLQEWPAGGPPVVWSITGLGKGYGTVAIQRDHIFVQGTKGKDSVVFCLNRRDGKILWSSALGTNLEQSRGGGPRGTPTVDGERVYILTENGDLACLQTRDSSVVWYRNILRDFKGRNPNWLVSESPLIDGNHVIVTPGGPNASVVALDKMSGKTVWTSKELSDRAAYSSCLVADVQGVRTVLAFTASAAVGLRATDGKLMWRYRPVANRTANVTTPIFRNDKVFFTSAYGTGCALLALKAQGNEVKAEEIYFSRDMQNHHGGVVLVDGYVYGFSSRILTCMDFETGKRVWRARSVGKGSLTCADGRLYLLSENNVVALAEATPEGYREKGRFVIQDEGWPSWAHPVVSGGKLYIRNQGRLTSYNIQAD